MEADCGVVLGFDVGRYSHHMTAIDARTGEVTASLPVGVPRASRVRRTGSRRRRAQAPSPAGTAPTDDPKVVVAGTFREGCVTR